MDNDVVNNNNNNDTLHQTGKWSKREKDLFLIGFSKYRDVRSKNIQHILKKTDWRAIAKIIQTRTFTQTFLYARRYLRLRLKNKKNILPYDPMIPLPDNLYKLSGSEARDYIAFHKDDCHGIQHDLHFIVEAPLSTTDEEQCTTTTNVYFAAKGIEKDNTTPIFDHVLDYPPLDIDHFNLPDPFEDCDIQNEAYLFH